MKFVTVGVFLVAVGGCRLFDSNPVVFPDARSYAHALFATPQACADAQRIGFINCSQVLTLCPNGNAVFIVTDIQLPASYSIVRPRLTLRVEDNPETGSEYVFNVSEDERTLTLLFNNTRWEREASSEEAERACAPRGLD